jgi:hypothetical protein
VLEPLSIVLELALAGLSPLELDAKSRD